MSSTSGLRLTVGDGPVFFRDLFLVPIELDLDAKTVNAWVSIVSSGKSMEKAAIAMRASPWAQSASRSRPLVEPLRAL